MKINKNQVLRCYLLSLILIVLGSTAFSQQRERLPLSKSEWSQIINQYQSKFPQSNPSVQNTARVALAQEDELSGWDDQFALNGILGHDVYAAKTANGSIYIGGDFDAVGKVPANNIAMWDGEKWNAMGEGLNGPVHAIYINEMNNDVFAGGMFTHSGDEEMNFLAKWNGEQWEPVGKTPNDIKGVDVGAYVNVLEGVSGFMGNTTLYVGGSFNNTDNVEGTSYLSVWDGNEWQSIGGGSDRLVTALYNYGGHIYAGGFGSFGGVSFMARWDGVEWQKMGENQGPNDAASTFFANGDNLYVGGFFTLIDEKPLQYIAQYDMVNNQWHRLGYENGKPEPEYSQPNGSVRSICFVNDNLVIGGYFDKVGQTSINHIGYFSFNDLSFHPINKGIDNVVRVVFSDFDKLYAFGAFNGVNRGLSEESNDVAYGVSYSMIDYDNLSDSEWKAFETDTFNGIYSAGERLIEKNGDIYLVGSITYAGDEPISYIAKWNGQSWDKLADGLYAGWINDLVFIENDLYVGGYLAVDADQEYICPLVARWDGNAWKPLGYGLAGTINSQVFALETDGQNLFVGGLDLYFAINPDKSIVEVGNVAKWNGSTWSAMGDLDLGVGLVRSLEFHQEKLYAGGLISKSNQDGISNLAYWDGQKWVKEGEFDAAIYTLKSVGDKLYAGGEFSKSIKVFENNEWGFVGEGFGQYSWVSDIEVVNNKVLAAGYITSDNSGNQLGNVVYFDGDGWENLGGGSSWIVTDILPIHNNFYIAGYGGILGGKVPYSGFSFWNDKNYDIALGIGGGKIKDAEKLTVYPNPSNGLIKVLVPTDIKEKAIYTVTDISGKVVLSGELKPYEPVLKISINRSGLYVLKITEGSKAYVTKIIVE